MEEVLKTKEYMNDIVIETIAEGLVDSSVKTFDDLMLIVLKLRYRDAINLGLTEYAKMLTDTFEKSLNIKIPDGYLKMC